MMNIIATYCHCPCHSSGHCTGGCCENANLKGRFEKHVFGTNPRFTVREEEEPDEDSPKKPPIKDYMGGER